VSAPIRGVGTRESPQKTGQVIFPGRLPGGSGTSPESGTGPSGSCL